MCLIKVKASMTSQNNSKGGIFSLMNSEEDNILKRRQSGGNPGRRLKGRRLSVTEDKGL